MIVKVTPQQASILEKICATWDLDFSKFTIENNPLLVQVEILNEGEEIRPETAFHICAMLSTEEAVETFKSK